jgi:uncharacterized protein involved in type VI secretion and phage assembly
MAQQIDIQIELEGGKEIKPFTSIIINQSIGGHHSFELKFPSDVLDKLEDSIFNTSKNMIGKGIMVSMDGKTTDDQPKNTFKGIITEVSLEQNDISSPQLVFKGYGPTILIDNVPSCSSSLDKNIGQIVKKLTSTIPQNLAGVKVNPRYTSTLKYHVQYNETDFAYLKRLAAEFGEWFFYDGSDFHFGMPSMQKTININFRKDVSDIHLSMKLQPLKFSYSSYDYLTHQVNQAKSSSAQVSGLDNFGKVASSESNKLFVNENNSLSPVTLANKNDLEQHVKIKKAEQAANMVVLTGSCDSPYLKIGAIVNVSLTKRSDTGKESVEDFGKYTIITVNHRTNGIGNYQNHFEAIPSTLQVLPTQNVSRPIAEPQIATVLKNNDPDGMGRIKVRLAWQTNAEETPWLRVITPYAGDKKGFYFIPEVDEQVFVSFENNDPNLPFVSNAFFHSKQKHEWNDPKNYIKGIKTKSGNVIQFNDEPGKETITVFNKDKTNEITLTMKDDGKITITAKSEISLKSKKIKIDAEELTINASKSMKTKAPETTFDATKEFGIKATKLNAESAGVNIKSSAMIEIAASAIASVKAGIIKLN